MSHPVDLLVGDWNGCASFGYFEVIAATEAALAERDLTDELRHSSYGLT